MNLHKVKSFSVNPKEGNLAGVVTDVGNLSDLEMLNIAKEVGASETAFILPSKHADFRIRWFTPNVEVGLCIHATIAALGVLRSQNFFNSDTVTVETKNTQLLCKIDKNNIFVKISGYYTISNELNFLEILPLLPINNNQLICNFTPQLYN